MFRQLNPLLFVAMEFEIKNRHISDYTSLHTITLNQLKHNMYDKSVAFVIILIH